MSNPEHDPRPGPSTPSQPVTWGAASVPRAKREPLPTWLWGLIGLGALFVLIVVAYAGGAASLHDDPAAQRVSPATSPPPAPRAAAPIVVSGSGDDVLKITKDETPALIRIAGNAANAYFGVTALAAIGSNDLLVNTTSAYSGIRPLDFQSGRRTVGLEIQATGAWTVAILSLSAARQFSPGAPIAGNGDEVIYAVPPVSTYQIVGNKSGAYFGVHETNGSGSDLLVNTTDPYRGRVLSQGGGFLTITAEGPWTVLSEP